MKLLIIGHARHGKDTAAEMLEGLYGYKAKSSSLAAAEIFIYDELKDKYGYTTPEQCFEDRVNHRPEWFIMIVDYNKDDKARLAKDIMKSADIYTGMRSNEEVEECLKQEIFDWVIGIYDPRKPLEPESSFNINIWERSDFIVPNAQGLDDLLRRLTKLYPVLAPSAI